MNCKVQRVYKNIRYRILTIGEQVYILDMGQSFWKSLFPLFFWMFPVFVYKVDDPKNIEKLNLPKVKQANTAGLGLLGGGIAVLIANLTRGLPSYFDIQTPRLVNMVTVIIAVILVFSLRCYISHISKKKLYQVVKPEQLSTRRLWIRPKSNRHFFLVLCIYLFFLLFPIVGFIALINYPNVMILFISMFLLFFVSFTNFMTVTEGNTTVKFKEDK